METGTTSTISPQRLEQIALQFNLLTEAEKQQPLAQRLATIKAKLNIRFKNKKAEEAAALAAGQGGGTGNGAGVGQGQPGGMQQGQQQGMQQGQQQMQGGVNGAGQQQMGQSPRMVPGAPGQPPMNPGQQAAYQEQMRLQQQHQQQAHLSELMQKTQRLHQQQNQQIQANANQQQQQSQQQQQQQQPGPGPNGTMMPPQHPNVGHSPPNPAITGSPHASVGRSPSQNGPRQGSTPAPVVNNQTKSLIESFPKFLEMKRRGTLTPEQEKLFEQLTSTEAGRAHLLQISAREANAVIQNNLSNPVGQQPGQMPQQMAMPTPHQQLAQLQAHQAQQQQQHQTNGMPFPQQQFIQQPGGQPGQQLTPQQLQQLQFRQLASQQQQQQQGQGGPPMRPPNPTQAQQIANAQAQQARQQIMQAAGQTGMQQQAAQAQVRHMMEQRAEQQVEQSFGTPNYGSPRPNNPAPAGGQGQGPNAQRAAMNQVQQTMVKLQAMSEGQREAFLQQHPRERQFWDVWKNNANNQHAAAIAARAQAQAQAQNGPQQANSPNVRPAQASNGNGNANGGGGGNFAAGNMPNLHIPVNKQRNMVQQQQQSQSSQAGSPAAGTPPMRPPVPQQQNPRDAAVQRMINQGIPVAGGPGGPGARPGNGDIKPFMLLAQMKNQPTADSIHPGALRTSSDQHIPQLDRSASLLAKVTWAPSDESDAALRAKLSDFRRPLKPLGRSTLHSGLGVSRVIGDVLLEQMPEGLSAMAEEAEGIASGVNANDGEGGKKKVDEGSGVGSGMPGQKKRKIGEVARTVDNMLEVDSDVETAMLQLADEHIELVANVSCMLAKHRKSDSVDRKDIQLAYEMIESRAIPGFSSDLIRLDQAKSMKRAAAPLSQGRMNKIKLVQDARTSWRKDKAAAQAKKAKDAVDAAAAGDQGEGDASMEVNPVSGDGANGQGGNTAAGSGSGETNGIKDSSVLGPQGPATIPNGSAGTATAAVPVKGSESMAGPTKGGSGLVAAPVGMVV